MGRYPGLIARTGGKDSETVNSTIPESLNSQSFLVKMAFAHESECLEAGLYHRHSDADANDAEGDIQQSEKYQILNIPLPFK